MGQSQEIKSQPTNNDHVALACQRSSVVPAPGKLRLVGPKYEAPRPTHKFVCSGSNVLTAGSVGSGGETRHQLYNQLGAGKLDSVYFQSIPTDEAKRAGYFLRRLDAALATLE